MGIRTNLRELCYTITGQTSNGKNIANILKDINDKYPDKITIDTNTGTIDLLGKTKSQLQDDVRIEANKVYGKLKYVDDYTGFSGDVSEQSGNYLVLHITANNSEPIKVELINGLHGQVTLDSDGILITRITNKATQTIQIKNGEKTVELDLTSLIIEQAPAN